MNKPSILGVLTLALAALAAPALGGCDRRSEAPVTPSGTTTPTPSTTPMPSPMPPASAASQ